jgi:hypothetical protein
VGSCRKSSASSIGRTASRYSCPMARDEQLNTYEDSLCQDVAGKPTFHPLALRQRAQQTPRAVPGAGDFRAPGCNPPEVERSG